jgi:hypothetical protein
MFVTVLHVDQNSQPNCANTVYERCVTLFHLGHGLSTWCEVDLRAPTNIGSHFSDFIDGT